WVSPVATPNFPVMANRYGQAYNCGIRRGTVSPALTVNLHVRSATFLAATGGMFGYNEWTLSPDDYTFNQDKNTWSFAYQETDDPALAGPRRPSGQVLDYTRRGVIFTIEWALANFPVDRPRVYAIGGSMGGPGALWLAFWRPDLFAGIFAGTPRVNMASL